VQQAFAQVPTGKAITTVLLDVEYSTDAAVRALMAVLPEQAWTALRTQDGMTTDREVVEIGGKRITHGRQRLLKLAASVEKSRLYCERRWRTYALSSAEQGGCTRRSGMGGPLEGGVRLRDGSSQLWSG